MTAMPRHDATYTTAPSADAAMPLGPETAPAETKGSSRPPSAVIHTASAAESVTTARPSGNTATSLSSDGAGVSKRARSAPVASSNACSRDTPAGVSSACSMNGAAALATHSNPRARSTRRPSVASSPSCPGPTRSRVVPSAATRTTLRLRPLLSSSSPVAGSTSIPSGSRSRSPTRTTSRAPSTRNHRRSTAART